MMLRRLLADRFRLVVRTEIRDAQIRALVMARGDGVLGPRLSRSALACESIASPAQGEPQGLAAEGIPMLMGAPPDSRPVCGARMYMRPGDAVIDYIAGGTTISGFATFLGSYLGQTVIDATGLTGSYDLSLRFSPPRTPTANPAIDAPIVGGPAIVDALKDQLGLRLETRQGPLEVLVIENVEHPTPN
jgi:uncharacterized protein (TIGR03435 family)